MTRELPKEFIAAQSKGAFFATSMLRAVTQASLLLALAVLALLVHAWIGGGLLDYRDVAYRVIRHPASQVLIALLLIRAARRIQLRLADKDPA
jgi:uncharacterized SAM-binding protein YcdF (DUF218 family)